VTAAQAGAKYPAETQLLLFVYNTGSSTQAAVTPGTYDVSLLSSPSAAGAIAQIDANGCSNNSGGLSGSGTITITSVDSSGVAGSYNLNFVNASGGSAGSLSGTFDAPNCAVDTSKFCNATKGSC
jgi:hypothetical protein